MNINSDDNGNDMVSHRHWIIPCNIKKYDVIGAFNKLKKIIWKQNNAQAIGNLVFIYVGKPFQTIKFMCSVSKVDISELNFTRTDQEFILDGSNYEHFGNYMELTLLAECDISIEFLRGIGLKGNIQSPRRIDYRILEELQSKLADKFEVEYVDVIESSEVDEAKELTGKELLTKAAIISKRIVKPYKTTTLNYYRSPIIAKAAKERADGICQLCGQKAPFNDKNNNPYLESHHVIWLSHGGEDSIENTVALCPNCHRRMHLLNKDTDVQELQNKIKSIKTSNSEKEELD